MPEIDFHAECIDCGETLEVDVKYNHNQVVLSVEFCKECEKAAREEERYQVEKEMSK